VAGLHSTKQQTGPNIQIRAIASSVKHPNYQPPSASDAAFCDAGIIKVDKPFIFNQFVRKIKLPPFDHDPPGITLKQKRYLIC